MSQLNIELFIARRIFRSQKTSRRFSESIVSFAVFGIAFGLFVMLLSIAVVTGFKKEIRNKVIGFGSHIQLVNFDSNSSYETVPVPKHQPWLSSVSQLPGVKNIQVFATKPGIIKTVDEIHGIVVKGVGADFDWSFFKENLVEGSVFTVSDSARSDDVLISKQVAKLLKLKVGDPLYTYFLNEESKEQKMRKFKISGIFSTSLEEFDRLFVLADIGQVQKLNNWSPDQVSGYEISISDFSQLASLTQQVRRITLKYSKDDEAVVRPVAITSKYPQIFDWLNLLDMNVWIILGLIILVAGFNMVSGLLILMLERTTMIGVLKALGAPNWSIRKVFIYISTFLILRGMLWGNLAAFAFFLIQKQFGLFTLDPTAYYLNTVPINVELYPIVLLNLGTIFVTLLMLLVPSWYVTKIDPDKAIRFD